MLEILAVTPDVHVAAQLRIEDMPAVAQRGIKTIINNRRDFEFAGQPTNKQIEAAAAQHGMRVEFVPVAPGSFEQRDIDSFRRALESNEGPYLAFCRSGTRSIMLWGLSQAGTMPAQEILDRSRAAGYDLTAIAYRFG